MVYILDTDVIIDFLLKKGPGFSLVSKILNKKLFISVITWIEILYGIKKVKASSKRSEQFINFIKDLDIEIIPINQEIGSLFTDFKVKLEERGEKLADFDLLIASTSKLYNLTLVTKNLKHFNRTGIKILASNPRG